MEFRKSVPCKRLDSIIHKSPASSSPLRRKSMNFQNISSNTLSENDDEAERIARRRDISTSVPISVTNSSNKRHSLGLGFLANIPALQMTESINQCIKLSAENKINIKNAFSLEMIDFMTYMIKKQDANMSNLQVASTSLDVSTKIYGFRVDNLHMEILKIVGGLDKQTADNMQKNSEEQEEQVDTEANVDDSQQKRKKKKKNKQKIFSTVEVLRSNIEIAKPMSMMMGEGDLQTSDMLYQATLPNHAGSGYYLHPYNDVIIDVVEHGSEMRDNSDTKYSVPVIEDLSNLEICPSYSNFEFLGWSVDNEPEEPVLPPEVEEINRDDESNNRFQFDLDASVERNDDNLASEPMNYFDIEHDDDDENVHGCYRRAGNHRNENITDAVDNDVRMLKTITPEYSFVQSRVALHWAGPSHWKFRNFMKSFTGATVTAASSKTETCMQTPLRKKKQFELTYDENRDVIDAKFAPSTSTKLQAKHVKTEWNVETLTLPEDVHYDIAQMTKLYLHTKLTIKPVNDEGKEDSSNVVTAADVSDGEEYDYNNPNDTSEYCPNVNNDNYDDGDKEDCRDFEGDAAEIISQGLIGDNLIAAPKLANKISIAYCRKPKKIDMRQLKKAMWDCLKSVRDNENAMNQESMKEMEENKRFSNVNEALPKLLTKANTEALSVPISFISLLHLANEKDLELNSPLDMSDIIIKKS